MWWTQDEVAAHIRQMRLEGGHRLQEMADHIGVSVPTMHRYENGTKSIPYKSLRLIADYFGVSATYLLEGRQAAAEQHGAGTGPSEGSDSLTALRQEQMVTEALRRRVKELEDKLDKVKVGACYDPQCILVGNHRMGHYDGTRRYFRAPSAKE